VNRVATHFAGKDAALALSKIDELVPQLVQPLRDAGRLPGVLPTVAAAASPTPVDLHATPPSSSTTPVAAYATLGGAGVAVVVGALLLAQGVTDHNAVSQGYAVGGRASAELGVGGTLVGVGVVAAGVGLYLLLRSPTGASVALTPAVAYRPGSNALVFDLP
jgi:hypothetical protein